MTRLRGIDLLMEGDGAPEPTQAQASGRINGVDLLMGANTSAAAPQQPAQPKEEGWGEWIANSVKGRQDPAYAGTPSVFSQFTDQLRDPTGYAALAGASDAQMGDVIRQQLGNRVLRTETDANGYDVLVTRGADGKEQRGYVNRPGLDTEDAWRMFYGALPYAATGGGAALATRGAGVGLKTLAQGTAATATSAAGDVAQMPLGSQQGIEVGKAAITGALGAAGPMAGSIAGRLWNRFVTVPGLVDRGTGKLTPKGVAAAREAGIDPADLDADFSQRFAQALADAGDADAAAFRAGTSTFGIPVTAGQITKDPARLVQEESMRRGLMGDAAGNTMRQFYDDQTAAIQAATSGHHTRGRRGMADVVARGSNRNPGRFQEDASPAVLGDSIGDAIKGARQTAGDAESAMWDGIGNLEATDDAFKILPNMVSRHIGDRVVDTQITPAAARMAQEMDRFISGEAPDAVANVLRQNPVKSVDQMRRRLLGIMKGASTGEDAGAARSLYEGFNDWIGEAAALRLLKGEPEDAAKMVAARGFRREISEIFAPGLGKTPAAQRLSKILDGKADSGEQVVSAIFGSANSATTPNGTVGALRSIREALTRFGGDGAEQAWNDIRVAYWNRVVLDKTGKVVGTPATKGEPFGAVSLSNAIKRAMKEQRSVLETLFSPEERRMMGQLTRTLDGVSFKPPNASGSGYTAAAIVKDWMGRFLDSMGVGVAGRMALNFSGLDKAYGAAVAQRAVKGAVRPRRPDLGPITAPVGQQYDRQSR